MPKTIQRINGKEYLDFKSEISPKMLNLNDIVAPAIEQVILLGINVREEADIL